MTVASPSTFHAAIVGGGPAGLMAAEVLAEAGVQVALYDAMPSLGRKFLLAGVGGMNITHAEAKPAFISRYGAQQTDVARWLETFDADALRQWIHNLGIETFVGTSGRVFPRDMKAAPLLRAWLKRLREQGVSLHPRHRWQGFAADGSLLLEGPAGALSVSADVYLLALGGGSWARLGSDGAWQALLANKGVTINALRPSNCGFEVDAWSDLLKTKFAGAPLKNVAISCAGFAPRIGECIVTEHGLEGSLVYAASSTLRQQIERNGQALLHIDLLPQTPLDKLTRQLAQPRGKHSMAKHLQRQAGLEGVKAALLRELAPASAFTDAAQLAALIKHLPLQLVRTRPLDEAISSAGGVCLHALDQQLMLKVLPGVFCAGEMLDWEAPTGGYLLTACFASGRLAAQGALNWLQIR